MSSEALFVQYNKPLGRERERESVRVLFRDLRTSVGDIIL